jgi:DNA-binding MarR family transcriptional regulator
VSRTSDAKDGRVVRVRATAKGTRALQRARERRIANLAGRLANLEASEVARIHEAAELLERALAQEP